MLKFDIYSITIIKEKKCTSHNLLRNFLHSRIERFTNLIYEIVQKIVAVHDNIEDIPFTFPL